MSPRCEILTSGVTCAPVLYKKGERQLAKFTTGPDWMDIEVMLRALDGIHSGRTRLAISAAGAGSTGGLLITITTDFDALPGGRQFPQVVSVSEYPCKQCRRLEDHIFGGLYQHDVNIGKAYEQMELPE